MELTRHEKAIKILVIILAVALILVSGAFLFWKFGTQTGQIGEQVFYTYIKPTKTIVIHGQGEMWDY